MEFQELIRKGLEVRQKAYAPIRILWWEQHFCAKKTAGYLLDATLKMLLMERLQLCTERTAFSKQSLG